MGTALAARRGRDYDYLMRTELKLSVAFGDESLFPARQLPWYLTAAARVALAEDGALVQVYFDSRIILFRGSKDFLPLPLPVDVTDSSYPSYPETGTGTGTAAAPVPPLGLLHSDLIFSDINPDKHFLILQEGIRQTTISTQKPLLQAKAIVAHLLRKLRARADQTTIRRRPASCEQVPPLLTVIRTENNKFLNSSHASNKLKMAKAPINKLVELARENDKRCSLGVLFGDWKLSITSLSALPLVPSLDNHLPWFYVANPGTSLGNHIFGNMTTHQSFLVANSDLQSSTRLLYSKNGWLLLQGLERAPSSSANFPMYRVFLLNPTTGVRMDLPSLHFLGAFATFSMTTQGTPGVIFYVHRISCCILSVFMARPGSAYWEEHPYVKRGVRGMVKKIVLCGGFLYCLFRPTLHCLIFKLADRSWHFVTSGNLMLDPSCYEPLEVDGKVVLAGHPTYYSTMDSLGRESVPFFMMEMSGDKLELVKITGDHEMLNGRIWFIHNGGQSFCVKVAGSGKMICWFDGRYFNNREHLRGYAYTLRCSSLTGQANCRLTADSVICTRCARVDLGCSSDHGLLDQGITVNDLFPAF